ncbi:MAG: hypothetical protein M5R36_07985 [Deltaproteobacteria bacterium]|nr:hypothetical protein [Deltaproteobacteria bacterium]
MPGADLQQPNVYDAAPTSLAILGLARGEDMRGRVLASAFREPPSLGTIPSYGRVSTLPPARPPSPELIERLRSLGYIN